MANDLQNGAFASDDQQRLKTLAERWDALPSAGSEQLSLADLKLLLEHFTPFQSLIRKVATGHEQTIKAKQAESEERLAHVQAERQQTFDECAGLHKSLAECTTATQALMLENDSLKRQLQTLQTAMQSSQAELARSTQPPAALALLRNDAQLAEQMGLTSLPADNFDALAQAVAVLAQPENLQRLWELLKQRCEAQRRSANEAEHALLTYAIGWYNHNWRTRPWSLILASPGASFDFERHLRSRHTCSGESLDALYLPGIADGSGRAICKALVITH